MARPMAIFQDSRFKKNSSVYGLLNCCELTENDYVYFCPSDVNIIYDEFHLHTMQIKICSWIHAIRTAAIKKEILANKTGAHQVNWIQEMTIDGRYSLKHSDLFIAWSSNHVCLSILNSGRRSATDEKIIIGARNAEIAVDRPFLVIHFFSK